MMTKRAYLGAIKSINKWLKDNGEELKTENFLYRRERSELYCINPEIGPVKVDLDSYSRLAGLRELIEAELRVQLDHTPRQFSIEVEKMMGEVDNLSQQYRNLNERLLLHGCRLQISRTGEFRVIRIDPPDPEPAKVAAPLAPIPVIGAAVSSVTGESE